MNAALVTCLVGVAALGTPLEVEEIPFYEQYYRAYILGPLTQGDRSTLDPPSDEEVLRAPQRLRAQDDKRATWVSADCKVSRIVKEKIADYVDPPREAPLIGKVQLHHAHYKCTIYFTDTRRLGWPFPAAFQEEWSDVIYVDHNHFHMLATTDPKHERYERAPILGPLTAGGPAVALDPPSDDEVMRALERARPIQGGMPMIHEVQRNNVRIVKEKIADYVDPPRVVPLIGPAQLHHAHYKCTIHFSEVTRVGWPIPHTLRDEDAVEVLYIDHNHFHMVGNVDNRVSSPY